VRAAVAFIGASASVLVFRGLDDDREGLCRALASARELMIPHRILTLLAPSLQCIPPALASSIAVLFRDPTSVRGIQALAWRAGMSRRSLDRWLARAGLAPARILVAAARVVTSYRLMCEEAAPQKAVAQAMRSRSVRAWTREVVLVTGSTPGRLNRSLTREQFTERVVLIARRRAPTAGAKA